jgi:hypothetical protein
MKAEAREATSTLWIAMLVALGLHMAFASWVQPRTARARLQTVSLPDLTFWAQSSGESRALYSPVLFALPTPMGFSASMLNQPLQSDPPMKEQEGTLNMLQVEQRVAATPPPSVFPQDRYQSADALRVLPTASPIDPLATRLPEASAGLSMRYEGTALFRERVPRTVAELPGAGPVPWLAEFYVDLEEDSRVRRVLVESCPVPGPSKDVLIRWLYQQRFQPGPPVSGRVAVQWTPGTEGEGP